MEKKLSYYLLLFVVLTGLFTKQLFSQEKSISFDILNIKGPLHFNGSNYLKEKPFSAKGLTSVEEGDWVEGSISFWIKPDAYPAKDSVWNIIRFNWYDSPNPPAGHICTVSLTSEGKIKIHELWSWSRSYAGKSEPDIVSKNSLPVGMWSEVIIEWSKARNNICICINGVSEFKRENYIAIAVNSPTGKVYPWIGGYGGIKGTIQNLRIWGVSSAQANLYMEFLRQQEDVECEKTINKNTSFFCLLPKNGWVFNEYPKNYEEQKIYKIEGKNISDGTMITIKYYHPKSGWGIEKFIKRQAGLDKEVSKDIEKYEPLKKIKHENGFEVTEINREMKEYESIESSSSPSYWLKERIYVFPAYKEGFFTITYSTRKENFNRHWRTLKFIFDSFELMETEEGYNG